MATLCRLDVFLLFTFLNIISNSRLMADFKIAKVNAIATYAFGAMRIKAHSSQVLMAYL